MKDQIHVPVIQELEIQVSVDLTPEQDKEFDHLVDHGFNSYQAMNMVGATAVSQQVNLSELAKPSPSKTPPKASEEKQHNKRGLGDKRRLSPREQMIADEAPAHIRYSPYS